MIEQTRLLTLSAAHALDTTGSRAARKQVTLEKDCVDVGWHSNIVVVMPMLCFLYFQLVF